MKEEIADLQKYTEERLKLVRELGLSEGLCKHLENFSVKLDSFEKETADKYEQL